MAEVLSLCRMARRAGVTQQWLKAEAEAGRIPCLKAGKRFLFSPPAVLEALAVLAAKASVDEEGSQ